MPNGKLVLCPFVNKIVVLNEYYYFCYSNLWAIFYFLNYQKKLKGKNFFEFNGKKLGLWNFIYREDDQYVDKPTKPCLKNWDYITLFIKRITNM